MTYDYQREIDAARDHGPDPDAPSADECAELEAELRAHTERVIRRAES